MPAYIQLNRVPLLLSFLAAIAMLVSCGSDDALSTPTEGTVVVTTQTSGADEDPDGYTVSVDGSTPQAIGITDSLTIPDIDPGERPVILAGVAPNCAVGLGLNQRIVTVPVGDTVKVAFTVTCELSDSPPPPDDGDPVP